MPEPAIKPETPPIELTDRSEGWGITGNVRGYSGYGDTGEWPHTIVRNKEFDSNPSEMSDWDRT
jgi:hypothetical protein